MENLIEIRNFSWRYEVSPEWVLKDINLNIKKGEFLAITGHNEAGKTTLALSLNGLIPNNLLGRMKGDVIIKGLNTKVAKSSEITPYVGIAFENPETQFVHMTVEDDVVFGPENLGLSVDEIQKRLEWALKIVHMEDYLDKPPQELSGGQKQRVAIASILAMQPEILVLDEPTSQLDPIGKTEIIEVLHNLKKQRDLTVILIEHRSKEIVEFANRVVLLNHGRIELDLPTKKFFSNVDVLLENGVYPPQVTIMFHQLMKHSKFMGRIKNLPLTINEAEKQLRGIMG